MSTRLDRTLRSLDAAQSTLSDEQRLRADAHLDRIVATPLTSSPPTSAHQPSARHPSAPRRSLTRRLILVPTGALALAMAIVLLPGGGGSDPAYTTWTGTPTTISEGDLDAAMSACQRPVRRLMDDFGSAELALAERRGDHVALLYRTDDPDQSGSCLTTIAPGSGRVHHTLTAMGGSSGPAQLAPAAGFTQGAIAQLEGVSITDGAVGEQVVGVTIQAGELTVEATVRDGRYVAWWPGPAFGFGPVPPSGRGGPEPMLTYDLTLADGTVVTDVEPTRPR